MTRPTAHQSNRRMSLCGDVNITPLIDVLLVLLIIFMAALPLTQRGLDVHLPAVVSAQTPPASPARIVAEYTADGRLAINKQPVAVERAEQTLREIFAARQDKTLYVIGAPSVRYREILRVIDAARGAGVTRIGIVTEAMRREAATSNK